MGDSQKLENDLKEGELSAIDWHEMFVFRLSVRLGGRLEVLHTPLIEALAYLEMDVQEKKVERASQFLNMYFAGGFVDGEERQKYVDSLFEEAGIKEPMKLEWDKNALDKYRAAPKE